MNVTELSAESSELFGVFEALVVGDRTWTNAQCYDDELRLAAALLSLGIGPGDRVLLLEGNSREYIIGFRAILRSGGVVVQMSATASPQEIERVISHTD